MKAIYPGTFDPITLGHMDLIKRALNIFDQIIIAVAENKIKHPCFSLKERVNLIKEVFADDKRIDVIGFNGLLANLVRQQNCNVVLRGLRVISDFEHEFQLTNVNRALNPEMETVFLTPDEHFASVSSKIIREIASLGGDVTQFVHPKVEKALKKKFAI